MDISKPDPNRIERLAQGFAGNHHSVAVNFDHSSDNYEILVNGNSVWGSDGHPFTHEMVCSVADGIISTLNSLKA
ncbi:MAG: hypothetical protein RLW87_06965 [Alphaproteobacteria bacterium]